MAITLQVLMSCCFSLVETSTGTSFTLNNCFEDIHLAEEWQIWGISQECAKPRPF